MNEIQIFSNPQFGEIRTVMADNGEPMFCLADICASLGISNHRNVKARLDEDDVHLVDTTDNLGRNQQVIFVTESGLSSLIFGSKLELPCVYEQRKIPNVHTLRNAKKNQHRPGLNPGNIFEGVPGV